MHHHATLLLAVLAFHYEGKDAAEAKQQYSQDIKTACTSYDYDTLKVVKSEAGADPETEGFVAFTYRSASKLTADQPEEQVREVGLQAVCMFVYTLTAGASSIPCWLGYLAQHVACQQVVAVAAIQIVYRTCPGGNSRQREEERVAAIPVS